MLPVTIKTNSGPVTVGRAKGHQSTFVRVQLGSGIMAFVALLTDAQALEIAAALQAVAKAER